jgi:hypothetical protein
MASKGIRGLVRILAVFWSRSRSWSRKEPEILAEAEAGAGILKFRLLVSAPQHCILVWVT